MFELMGHVQDVKTITVECRGKDNIASGKGSNSTAEPV